jgi:M6 family metalloprotease-like protein
MFIRFAENLLLSGGIMKKLVIVSLICGLIAALIPGSTSAIDLSRGILLDIPEEKAEEQFGKLPASQLTEEELTQMSSYRFTADTLKVLAIMVEWINRPGTYPKETFDSLFFSRDFMPGGSIADYFYEVSYGQAIVVGEVIDWYDAGFYSGWFWFEDLFAILDPVIDYSQFDGDNNGDVDIAVFIRSGNGEEDSQDSWDIWSYAMIYPEGEGPGPFDGMHIPRWNTSPETRPLRDPLNPQNFSGVDTLNRIRVFAHEMAHGLGLPDLYDYDDKLVESTYYTPDDANDHPYMDWCLMGYYGYGLFSIGTDIPTHLCGWCKKEMGWINPVVLDTGTYDPLVVYNLETTNDSSLYMLPIDPAEGEYFLLEYRNRNSTGMFDKVDSDFSVYFWPDLTYGCDPLDRGLLITHVHDSLGANYWRINSGTPDYPHYTVAVEDAGYNPSQDAWSNPEGFVTDSALWWYPYETRKQAPFSNDVSGQELFGPATYPSSNGYSRPTGIVVQVDSIVDDKLYAFVHLPAQFLLGDANGDGAVDVGDVVYLVNYLYRSGPAPDPIEAGDANCDGHVDVGDVVFLVNYLYRGGDPPGC